MRRCGGDECLVILPGADQKEAVLFAERILNTLTTNSRSETDGDGGQGGTGAGVTLGYGIAAFPECAGNANELVACADANLYRAKASSRGAVQAAGQ